MAATTAETGAGSRLEYNAVTIGEITRISVPMPLSDAEVTPLLTDIEQYLPTMREMTCSVSGNWRADLYGRSATAPDLVAAWKSPVLTGDLWKLRFPDTAGTLWSFNAFIRSLSITVIPDQPVTFDLDMRLVLNASSEYLTIATNGVTPTSDLAAIGEGLFVRVSNDVGDAVVELHEPTGFRITMTRGESEATHLQSGFKREFLPTKRGFTFEIDANTTWSAVASRASVLVEATSDTQPSFHGIWKAHKRADFQVAWKNEAGIAGPLFHKWSMSGVMNDIRTELTHDVVRSTIPVRGTGEITIATEA